MRCSVIAIVATAVSFVPRHSALCDWDRLDNSLSKDVADDLISAQRKFGCYYDDVSCSFFDGRGECVLSKSTIVRNNRRSCNSRILTQSVERSIAGEVRSARRYGCEVDTVKCSMDQRNWVSCRSTPLSEYTSDKPAGTCDLSKLEGSLGFEIQKQMHKTMRKYDCPRLEAVNCHTTSRFGVDCEIEIDPDAHVGRGCRLYRITEKLTHELGEEILDAEVKYGCEIPPYLDCQNSHSGFVCALGDTAKNALGQEQRKQQQREQRRENFQRERRQRHYQRDPRREYQRDPRRERRQRQPPQQRRGAPQQRPPQQRREAPQQPPPQQRREAPPQPPRNEQPKPSAPQPPRKEQTADSKSGKPPRPPPPPPPPPPSPPADDMKAHARVHRVFRHSHKRDKEF